MRRRDVDGEVATLRAEQAARVMPLIGPLLDAWDNTDNDTKSTMRSEYPALCDYLGKLEAAMNLESLTTAQNGGER
jgi:hypothetical protein